MQDNLPGFVSRLSKAEEQLLAESAHLGRLVGPREFEAKFGGPCPMPKSYYGWR